MVHNHPMWPISELVACHPLNHTGAQGFPHDLAWVILKRLELSTAIQRQKLHLLILNGKEERVSSRNGVHPGVIRYIKHRCQEQFALQEKRSFSPRERLELLQRGLKRGVQVTKVCQEAHISRKRWYKWLRRYKAVGMSTKAYLHTFPNGTAYWKYQDKLKNSILALVVQHPEYGVVNLQKAIEVQTGKKQLTRYRIAAFLQHMGLGTAQQRIVYAKHNGNPKAERQTANVYTKLSVIQQKAFIERVLKGEKVTAVCQEAGICLSVFYEWIKKYCTSGGDAKGLASKRGYPRGETHYAYVPEKPRLILPVVKDHPEYSAPRIQKELMEQTGQPILKACTIQKFLRSMQLSTTAKRKAYAQASVTSVSSTVVP